MEIRPAQAWNPDLYDARHAFVYERGRDVVALLDPRPGERILDLGCGTGALAAEIAAAGATVTGIDASPEMIERARERFPGSDFAVDDARAFAFERPFDAIFSNAVLHWIPEAGAVAARVAAHLVPGGRFVAEFGGAGNVAAIVAALAAAARENAATDIVPGWYFPSVGTYAALLERHGLEVRLAELFDRPTPLAGGATGLATWLEMFAGGMLAQIPLERREDVVRSVEERLRPALFRDGVWIADYRRLRILAVRP